MEVLPVDLNAVLGIVMGMLVVLIPVAGLTARFAIKPITESIAKLRQGNVDQQVVALLERRVALLEQEVHGLGGMRDEVTRLLEEAEFQRQLKGPGADAGA
jgi:hypothetical protein